MKKKEYDLSKVDNDTVFDRGLVEAQLAHKGEIGTPLYSETIEALDHVETLKKSDLLGKYYKAVFMLIEERTASEIIRKNRVQVLEENKKLREYLHKAQASQNNMVELASFWRDENLNNYANLKISEFKLKQQAKNVTSNG